MVSGAALLVNPNTWSRLFGGLWVTILVSILSVALSIFFGLIFGWIMTKESKIIRAVSKLYLEFMRLMPQLVLLFIVYFGLAKALNIHILMLLPSRSTR